MASVLQNLAKLLAEADPERIARAKSMGFDTDNIYLHGTNKDINAFNNLRNPNGNYFSNSPEAANNYATKFGKENEGSNVIPVFLNKDKTFSTDYIWGNNGEDYPEQIRVPNPKQIRSIYANFDPEKKNSSDLLAQYALPAAGIGAAGVSELTPDQSDAADNTNKLSMHGDVAPTVAKAALHGATFGLNDPIEGLIGSAYAKLMRPDLFKDFSTSELANVAKSNVQADEDNTKQSHPYIYGGTELAASMLPFSKLAAALGGGAKGIYGANVLSGGIEGQEENGAGAQGAVDAAMFPFNLLTSDTQQNPENNEALKMANGGSVLESLAKMLAEADPERIARAEQQGYDTSKIYLHGTPANFENFNAGTWLTDEPGSANVYAGTNRDIEGANMIPVFKQKSLGDNDMDFGRAVYIDDPSKIRSIYAKFDPSKIDLSNLLASSAGLGLIGASAATNPNDGGLVKYPLSMYGDYSGQ